MKIRILTSAKKDLKDDHDFYELQQSGIGTYFLESLFADIESLKLFAGIHSIYFKNYYRLLSKKLKILKSEFMRSLTAAKDLHGSEKNLNRLPLS